MNRQTEKAMKAAMEYLNEHATGDESEKEMNELLMKFMNEYNSKLHDDDDEPTVDDYLEMAETTDSRGEAIDFLNKALELEPDNLDAQVRLLEVSSNTFEEEIEKLSQKIEEVKLKYKDEYDNSVGEFYMVFNTRPIIRLYYSLLADYIQCNMLRKAVSIAEEIIRLNENDNMGARHHLIQLYAYFEEEEKALELTEKYSHDGFTESQFLLSLAIIYYKKCDYAKAEEYIKQLNKENKGFKKFVKSINDLSIMDKIVDFDDSMYQPWTIDELIMEFVSNRYLYSSTTAFFMFAEECLKKKPAKKKTNKKKLS